MKPPPPGWPRISSALFYEDPAAAIDWLCAAFDFEVRLRVEGEGGRIEHSELEYGGGLIMVSDVRRQADRARPLPGASPRTSGVNTQSLCVAVEDAEAHCAHARAAGAEIVDEPSVHDYGDDYWADKTYRAIDLEGHHWYFMERVRGPKSS